jgi:AcrR family transcriptional regulator
MRYFSGVTEARAARQDAVNEHKRRLILDAARQVFESDGLDSASLRQIAKAAGYTPGAIYFHFAGKEAIYGALLEESLERLEAAVGDAVADTDDAAQRFRAAGLGWFDFYAANPRDLDLGFYLFRGGMRPHGLSPDLDSALNAKLLATLAPVTAAAVDLGSSRAAARRLTADVFAHASGLLLLEHTHRLKLFAAPARALMAEHLDGLLSRFG